MQKRSLIHGMSPSAIKDDQIEKGFNVIEINVGRKLKVEKYRMKNDSAFELQYDDVRNYDAPSPADYFDNDAYQILSRNKLVRIEGSED